MLSILITVTWTQHAQNKFIAKGSVPGAVYYDNTIYIYYCGIQPKPGTPKGDLGLAISKDKGATFTHSVVSIQGKAVTGTVDPAAVVIGTSEATAKP